MDIKPINNLQGDRLKMFNQVVEAAPSGTLHQGDAALIERYVEACIDVEVLESLVEEHGRLHHKNNGDIVTHPLVNQLKSAKVLQRQLFADLGLTPMERRKGKVEPEQKKSKLFSDMGL